LIKSEIATKAGITFSENAPLTMMPLRKERVITPHEPYSFRKYLRKE
jgi:hypothetical protein